MAKRYAKREEAAKASEEAKEIGTVEEIDKFSRRTVKVTREHNEECKRLLKLMGVPYVTAPCEAEAQCAALAKAGKVLSPDFVARLVCGVLGGGCCGGFGCVGLWDAGAGRWAVLTVGVCGGE